jgi:hypothetical protein
MSDAKNTSISPLWVAIGAGIIIALNLVMKAVLQEPIANSLLVSEVDGQQVIAFSTMTWVYVGVIALGSFPLGGLVIGYLSPGETIREPALACVLAVVVNSAWDYMNVSADPNFALGGWLVGIVIVMVLAFVLGLAGGWLGERLQGDTTDKMRERGLLPPT